MHVNVTGKHLRRRQTNVLIKLRAKMVTVIYKTDILMVFLFVLVFGMFFHYLLWIYEPPDLMNTEISYSERQSLIEEWKRKKMEEKLLRSGGSEEEMDLYLSKFAPGFDIGALQGPYGHHNVKIMGDIIEYKGKKDLSHEYIHNGPLSDLPLDRRKSHMVDSDVKNQDRRKIYEIIRARLYQDSSTENPKELLRDRSPSVIREQAEKLKIDINQNKTLVKKMRQKKRNLYWKLTTPKPGSNLQRVFEDLHIVNIEKANQTAVDKVIANLSQESYRVAGMNANEKALWLDEQSELLFRLMFHKDPHPKKSTDLNVSAPIGGEIHGGPAQCRFYDISVNINETFDCMAMVVKPKVTVCLYPTEVDIHISKHIREEGIWEPHIVKEFQNILFTNPDYGFIDIGANIGVYSLIAASMGHKVVAVEPYINNIRRFHKAAQIGGVVRNVTLLRNAIFDKRLDNMSLKLNEDNQGGIRVDPARKNPCLATTCTNTVKAIYMDDLLEVINFKKAVMKIDIEGFEHRAFVQSNELFKQVFISHIIMEWIILRGYYGSEVDYSEDKDLAQNLVNMLFDRGFRPFSLVTGIELKRRYWYAWPDDIIWKNDLEEFN